MMGLRNRIPATCGRSGSPMPGAALLVPRVSPGIVERRRPLDQHPWQGSIRWRSRPPPGSCQGNLARGVRRPYPLGGHPMSAAFIQQGQRSSGSSKGRLRGEAEDARHAPMQDRPWRGGSGRAMRRRREGRAEPRGRDGKAGLHVPEPGPRVARDMAEHLAKRVAGFGTSVFTEMSRLAVRISRGRTSSRRRPSRRSAPT